jgi:hypothetical protein
MKLMKHVIFWITIGPVIVGFWSLVVGAVAFQQQLSFVLENVNPAAVLKQKEQSRMIDLIAKKHGYSVVVTETIGEDQHE